MMQRKYQDYFDGAFKPSGQAFTRCSKQTIEHRLEMFLSSEESEFVACISLNLKRYLSAELCGSKEEVLKPEGKLALQLILMYLSSSIVDVNHRLHDQRNLAVQYLSLPSKLSSNAIFYDGCPQKGQQAQVLGSHRYFDHVNSQKRTKTMICNWCEFDAF